MAKTCDIYEDREATRYVDGVRDTVLQHIVKETPLTIMLNGEELATLVCSPHSFELLAIGFLVSAGVLQSRDELKNITCRPEQGVACVDTTGGAARTDGFLRRNFASCSGNGRPAFHFLSDFEQIQPILHETHFTASELLGFVALLDEGADTFRLTGGVHKAALAHREGLVVSYEDVGRHNALDRVLGYTFLNDIDTADKAVVLSGRIASEMLTKVARIGVPVVVSRSAPTCLSMDLAEQSGITLVGFARGDRLFVYAHPERIVG